MKATESQYQQALPEEFSVTTLEKNLAALSTTNESFFQRICLPVDGSHVHFLKNGEISYQINQTLFPFVMHEEELDGTLKDVKDSKNILLFGIGLGEQLDDLLKRCKTAKITAWDRDPWLIRLSLMKADFSSYISSGRLQLHMGADILDILDTAKTASIVRHPLLRSVYKNEWKLLQNGADAKRAMICSGGLFVDDVSKALEEFGYTPYTLDVKRLSVEEISLAIRRFKPLVAFAVNYTNGLAELFESHGVDLICWEVDPATDHIQPISSNSDRAYVFTYREANIEEFVKAGFKKVEYLPLASDTEKRSPAQLSAEEHGIYDANMSFVGSSMTENAISLRKIFLSQYKAYRDGSADAVEEGNQLLEEILSIQRQDFSIYVIPDLLDKTFFNFINYLFELPGAYDPFILVGEIAASEKRINYIANLGSLGVKVWGDEGWRSAEQYGVKYMGSAGHTFEINKIYSASSINVDINRLYQMDIIPMRIFDIMACGGFVLAEHSTELNNIFEIGKEVETYSTFDELASKAAYYLNHESEALEIAERGRDEVRKNHRISTRVEHMLKACAK
ncbi:MAG: glycosyltransferase [Deltaproteobacteria bacterium]|nr:glycosyltransferase [Deltaproteobacteria bacterium]